jgi:catechol 2,3-dioxygenase-like lactoylglutathione lyase family enzyme
MFALEHLDHVALSVRDLECSVNWYEDVLGFSNLYPGLWNGVPVFVGRDNAALALFPLAKENATMSSSGQSGPSVLHFAFRATRQNFLEAQRQLKARDIALEFEDHGISHSIYFRDPDGHKIEITTYQLTERG